MSVCALESVAVAPSWCYCVFDWAAWVCYVEAHACMCMYVPVPDLPGLRPFVHLHIAVAAVAPPAHFKLLAALLAPAQKTRHLQQGGHAQQRSGLCPQAGASRVKGVSGGQRGSMFALHGVLCVWRCRAVSFSWWAVCNGLPTGALLCVECAAALRTCGAITTFFLCACFFSGTGVTCVSVGTHTHGRVALFPPQVLSHPAACNQQP